MRPFLSTVLLSLALLAPAGVAHAGDDHYAELVTRLGLSADQQARVEEIIYQSKGSRLEIRARLEKARLDLKHHLGADTLDEKAVRRATEDLNAASAALVQNRVDQVIALRKVLDPAQFSQLEALWQGGRGDRLEQLRARFRGGDGQDDR